MLNFVKWAFRSFYGIWLWIKLIVCIIGGGVAGYFGGGAFDGQTLWMIVGVVAGLIAGAIIGLLSNIIFGGLIATFLDMGSDVTNIKAANARIEADVAGIKGFAADMRTSTAETAAVFRKMANRNAPGGAA
jgi:hypothetical protein